MDNERQSEGKLQFEKMLREEKLTRREFIRESLMASFSLCFPPLDKRIIPGVEWKSIIQRYDGVSIPSLIGSPEGRRMASSIIKEVDVIAKELEPGSFPGERSMFLTYSKEEWTTTAQRYGFNKNAVAVTISGKEGNIFQFLNLSDPMFKIPISSGSETVPALIYILTHERTHALCPYKSVRESNLPITFSNGSKEVERSELDLSYFAMGGDLVAELQHGGVNYKMHLFRDFEEAMAHYLTRRRLSSWQIPIPADCTLSFKNAVQVIDILTDKNGSFLKQVRLIGMRRNSNFLGMAQLLGGRSDLKTGIVLMQNAGAAAKGGISLEEFRQKVMLSKNGENVLGKDEGKLDKLTYELPWSPQVFTSGEDQGKK